MFLRAVLLCSLVVAVANAREWKALSQRTRSVQGPGVARQRKTMDLQPLLEVLLKKETAGAQEKRQMCGVPTQITSAQEPLITGKHNTLRGMEGASDMSRMTYNTDLANRAQEWAAKCIWDHGLLELCNGDGLGQNMYLTSGYQSYPTLDVEGAIQGWYDEKKDYNYNTGGCTWGKMCGHYTQVVWADSTEVGCGTAQCPTIVVNGTWTNAVIFVCNYAPSGNWHGEKPFQIGESCSECKWNPGHGTTCSENLCTNCSPSHDSSCTCPYTRNCNGHGRLNPDTCGCTCDTGYYGDECENSCACENDPDMGWACPQWSSLCTDPMYKQFMKDTCKKECGLCSTPPGAC
jgi:hypothetical protein